MADTIEQIFEEIVGGAPENVVAFPRPVDEEFDDMEHTFRRLALGGSDGTQVLGNAYNAGLILQTDHRVKGILGYDGFREQTVIVGDIDTGVECVPTVRVRGVEQLGAHHLDALMAFMQAPSEIRGEIGGHGCSVTRQALEVGVSNTARQNTFDPVKQLIEREKWDGQPRLDTWISRYLGTPDDVYHREVGVKWMTAAVARVYEPGAKFDFTLTVRGDQGTRKSTMFEVLGGDFYTSLGVGAMKDEKKLIEATAGSWIVEIAEMAAMQSNSADVNKNFISTTVDKARMAYDRITSDHRRRFVFGITTNNRGIIDDPTGARRFWIVDVAKVTCPPEVPSL